MIHVTLPSFLPGLEIFLRLLFQLFHLDLETEHLVLQLQQLPGFLLQFSFVVQLLLVGLISKVQPQLSLLIQLYLKVVVLLSELPLLDRPNLFVDLPRHVLLLQGIDE